MNDTEREPEKDATIEAPPETDASPLLDHEYDGIKEYDNPLPSWWKQIFWITVFFSAGYFLYYQVLGTGASVEQAYAEDMREHRRMLAERAMPTDDLTEEALAKITGDTTFVNDGRSIFALRCQPCHADRGQGNIGPNLTDEFWIHGSGSLLDTFKVVAQGVPNKGMPAWEMQLSAVELRQVVAFVGSLRGTKIPGKAPEGEMRN